MAQDYIVVKAVSNFLEMSVEITEQLTELAEKDNPELKNNSDFTKFRDTVSVTNKILNDTAVPITVAKLKSS